MDYEDPETTNTMVPLLTKLLRLILMVGFSRISVRECSVDDGGRVLTEDMC